LVQIKEVNSNIVSREIDINLISNMTVDVEVEILNSISRIRKIKGPKLRIKN